MCNADFRAGFQSFGNIYLSAFGEVDVGFGIVLDNRLTIYREICVPADIDTAAVCACGIVSYGAVPCHYHGSSISVEAVDVDTAACFCRLAVLDGNVLKYQIAVDVEAAAVAAVVAAATCAALYRAVPYSESRPVGYADHAAAVFVRSETAVYRMSFKINDCRYAFRNIDTSYCVNILGKYVFLAFKGVYAVYRRTEKIRSGRRRDSLVQCRDRGVLRYFTGGIFAVSREKCFTFIPAPEYISVNVGSRQVHLAAVYHSMAARCRRSNSIVFGVLGYYGHGLFLGDDLLILNIIIISRHICRSIGPFENKRFQ